MKNYDVKITYGRGKVSFREIVTAYNEAGVINKLSIHRPNELLGARTITINPKTK